MIRILEGHVLDVLRGLPAESVHCVVTSPPYYGLRNYGVPPQVWPDGWRGSLGLEPTLELYLDHMAEVCREIRRVLRADGTFWCNLGDGYANKQLQLVPHRLALRLQDDGWWVRSEIVWAKDAPMPESCTDRPTSAHEKVFLLTKSARYFYDGEAVKEEASENTNDGHFTNVPKDYHNGRTGRFNQFRPPTRNLRNVWRLPPAPFSDAHFATFPPELPRRCIKAGTSEKGVCGKCLAPYGRIVKKTSVTPVDYDGKWANAEPQAAARRMLANVRARRQSGEDHDNPFPGAETIGWRPTCGCDDLGNAEPVPATVLDPFIGAGTTALVADQLQRDCIGIELSPKYAEMAKTRIAAGSPLFCQVSHESENQSLSAAD